MRPQNENREAVCLENLQTKKKKKQITSFFFADFLGHYIL